MILCITLNIALDVTYAVKDVACGQVNRVSGVTRRAGGKGVNVARVLAQLGESVMVAGFAGGSTGAWITRELQDSRVPAMLCPIAGCSRMTVTVTGRRPGHRADAATEFLEPGPALTDHEWCEARDAITSLMDSATCVVVSGSLAPGVPADAGATFTRAAADRGLPAIVDTTGPALIAAAAAAAVVKPNAYEARDATGHDDLANAATALTAMGASAAVVSDGSRGVICSCPPLLWRAQGRRRRGHPVGAGDAMVAGVARGLVRGHPWPEILTDACALGAAAVGISYAGEIDAEWKRLRSETTVTAMGTKRPVP